MRNYDAKMLLVNKHDDSRRVLQNKTDKYRDPEKKKASGK